MACAGLQVTVSRMLSLANTSPFTNSPFYSQTKFGRLFVKKHSNVKEVLVELTEDQLIVRSHRKQAPPSEETAMEEVNYSIV